MRLYPPVPFMARLGGAYVEPHRWTLTGEISYHAGASYKRFDVPDVSVASRLRIQFWSVARS